MLLAKLNHRQLDIKRESKGLKMATDSKTSKKTSNKSKKNGQPAVSPEAPNPEVTASPTPGAAASTTTEENDNMGKTNENGSAQAPETPKRKGGRPRGNRPRCQACGQLMPKPKDLTPEQRQKSVARAILMLRQAGQIEQAERVAREAGLPPETGTEAQPSA